MKKSVFFLIFSVLLLCGLFMGGAAQAATDPCPDGAHQYGAWVVTNGPTCTEKGSHTRTCTLCGASQTQEINALGHDFSTDYVVIRPATCTEDGTKAYQCSRCGETKGLVVVEKTGHNFGAWAVKTPAGCLTDGVESRVCANCHEERTRAIPALGHDEVIDPPIEPRCMVNGRTQGSHCSRCGTVFVKPEPILSTGHTAVDDPAVEPTCTEAGKTAGSHCATCGLVIEPQTTIPKLGHKTVIDPAVSSTCSTPGKTEGSHCEVCGEVFFPQKDLPMRAHEYETTVIPKTCTTNGYTLQTCKLCGAKNMSDFDYAPGHKPVVEKQIEETCTTDGLSVKTYCAVCGEVLEEAHVIKALGHQWTTKTTPATTRKDGRAVTTCSLCGIMKEGGDVKIARIASVKLSNKKFFCDGKKKTPTVTVTDTNGTVLKNKRDYTLSYDSGRKKVGTYFITVTFRGNYAGTKALYFKILLNKPKNLTAKMKKTVISFNWDKTPGTTKYFIYCSPTKNGTYAKVGSSTKNSVNIKKLEKGKTYYFKVCAYTVSTTGEKVYSAYSAPVKIKMT